MSESLDPGVSLTWRLLRYRWLITISTAVLAVDQGTKAWIRARLPFNTYGEAAGAIRVVRGFLYIVHGGNAGPRWNTLAGGHPARRPRRSHPGRDLLRAPRSRAGRTLCAGLLRPALRRDSGEPGGPHHARPRDRFPRLPFWRVRLPDLQPRRHGNLHRCSALYPILAEVVPARRLLGAVPGALTRRSPSAPGRAPARSSAR